MDYEGTLFSELIPSFLDNGAVVDDMNRDMPASVDEDANFTIIEGSSSIVGDLHDGLEAMAPLESGGAVDALNPTNLLSLCDELRELWVGEDSIWVEQCIDKYLMPQERNGSQSFPVDPVAAYFGESVPFLNPPETDVYPANMDVEYNYASSSGRGQLPQSYPDPMESHFISGYHRDQHELFACIVCGNFSTSQIVRACGHAFCQHYCRQAWILGEGQACPDCSWYLWDSAPEADNLECRTDDDEDPSELVPIPQEYLPRLPPPRELDITGCSVQRETAELDQELRLEYQPVLQEAEREYLQEIFAAAELRQSLMPLEEISSAPKQSDGSRKRGRETLVVDHNGIAMRYDGSEERFTAYYRPSYWTEDDSSVFLGEYPTHEEAADAHNLVALLHEGEDAQLILPYTADRYSNELRRWEGRHHVDLVCELRLRGRGLWKDGGVNYKHVGRRWSGKKNGTRYFSTVSDDLVSSSNVKTGKAKRTYLSTFDTAEQAAQYADQVLVKRKGLEAWTNFPLTSYIPSKELSLSFLPISNNFRDNLTYKRTRA